MANREVVWTRNSEIQLKEILEDKIMVLKVWDCKQNPEKLNIDR